MDEQTALCVFCGEVVQSAEQAFNMVQVAHGDCLLRSVVGSVGHQLGKCSCYGGSEEDPPGLTPRQAARAAADLWRKRLTYGLVPGLPPIGGRDQ